MRRLHRDGWKPVVERDKFFVKLSLPAYCFAYLCRLRLPVCASPSAVMATEKANPFPMLTTATKSPRAASATINGGEIVTRIYLKGGHFCDVPSDLNQAYSMLKDAA